MTRQIDILLNATATGGGGKHGVVGASFYSMSTRLAQVLLQFLTIIILARFLVPADFGIYGMVTPLIAFFLVLRDAGLGIATLQSSTLSERQASTLFYTNVLVGITLAALFVLSAPAVAHFYGEERLIDLIRAFTIMFLFSGIRVQLEALVYRGYRFHAVFRMEIVASSAALVVGVTAAVLGYGYWALCIRQLSYEVIYTSSLLIYVRWLPRYFSMDIGTFSLFKFGVNAAVSNFIVYFLRNIDNVLIGWKLGPAALGPYALGYRTVLLPIQQVVTPLARVFIPHLSQQRDDPGGFARSYGNALKAMLFFVAPPLCAMIICTNEAVQVLLGPKWHESVRIIQYLIPAGIFQVAYLSAGWINFARGRADRQLGWSLLSLPVVVGGFVIGLQWGPAGVAASYSITNAILLVPLFAYAIRGTAITGRLMFRAIAPATGISAAVILAGYWLRSAAIDFGLSNSLILVLVALSTLLVMIATSPIVFGLDNLLAMGRHLKQRIGGPKLPLSSDAA
jgi:O-antigen/teichoic acid export membrane protein